MIDLVCSAPKGQNPTAVTQDHPESHVGRVLHRAIVRIVVFERVACEWIFKFLSSSVVCKKILLGDNRNRH